MPPSQRIAVVNVPTAGAFMPQEVIPVTAGGLKAPTLQNSTGAMAGQLSVGPAAGIIVTGQEITSEPQPFETA